MAYVLLIALLIFCTVSPASGQRVFSTIKTTAIEAGLKFDINDIPLTDTLREEDLNLAPNIVFAPDSSKAFVSFPGSNKVLVFDPATGDVIRLIEVGKNPTFLSMTPDQKRLAVPSLFFSDNLPQPGTNQGKLIGSVAIIDMETLDVRTVELSKVFFSFANNIVFSGDSKTGFIASSGTDEVLRFDVERAVEIQPRLKMGDGTRPSSLTVAHDFSFFTAVLVGSAFLDIRKVPDSVQIIDTASFQVRKSVVPKFAEDELPHNFFAPNTVALSRDGKYGIITDREISSSPLSPIPALSRDHALLFDVETGEVVKAFFVGGAAAATALMPDEKNFLVVSELELELVDLETQEARSVTPPRSSFKSGTRPAFSGDGTFMFVASPIDDKMLVFNVKTGEVKRLVKVGEKVEIEIGGVTVTLPAAPLDIAVSPDQSVTAVVNFNANSIDLLQPTTHLFVPRLISTGEWFTGVALTNTSSREAEVIVTGTDNVAILFQDDLSTEDVVEVVNPVTVPVGAGKQTAFTAHGIFQAVPQVDLDGWLEMGSNRAQMASFFMIGDSGLRRLDGAVAAAQTSPVVLLPEVRVTGGFNTEITILNPNASSTLVNVGLNDEQGNQIAQITDRPLLGLGTLKRRLRDVTPEVEEPEEPLFPEEVFENFTHGYIIVTSPEGVIAFERYYDEQRQSALNGVVLGGPDAQLYSTLYVPQAVAFGGAETFLNLIHVGTETAQVRAAFKDNRGTDLAPPVNLDLQQGHALRKNLAELFGLKDSGSSVAGWILLESSRPGLVATAEINAFNGRAMTTIPGQGELQSNFIFSHVAEALGLSTGVALLNPGPESASVQIEVFDPDGVRVAGRQLVLAAAQREAKMLKEWFPGLPEMAAGYITSSSDRGLVGLELFFAHNLELMSAVPAQPLVPAP